MWSRIPTSESLAFVRSVFQLSSQGQKIIWHPLPTVRRRRLKRKARQEGRQRGPIPRVPIEGTVAQKSIWPIAVRPFVELIRTLLLSRPAQILELMVELPQLQPDFDRG